MFTKWSLTGGGRLREVVAMRELTVVYFNSFYSLRFIVDFDPFWFLFPIHMVGVPLLLLYIKTNCYPRKLTGSKQLFKDFEKGGLQRQSSRLIAAH